MERHVRELGPEDAPALQALLESDPGYTARISGSPPGPDDALGVLTALPRASIRGASSSSA